MAIMKAFWWFKEKAISGMARPGFNAIQWYDLTFQESAVLSWIGQYPSGAAQLHHFRRHLRTYVPRILRFHGLDEVSGGQQIAVFDEKDGLATVLERLNGRMHLRRQSVTGRPWPFIASPESAARPP